MLRTRRLLLGLLALQISCSSVGTKDTDTPQVTPSRSGSQTSVFRDIGDFIADVASPTGRRLNQLVEKKDYEAAASYYSQELTFFRAQGNRYDKVLKSLARELNAPREPVLDRAAQRLVKHLANNDRSLQTWAPVKRDIADASELVKKYRSVALLQEDRFTSPSLAKVEGALADLRKTYEDLAPVAFDNYNHLGAGSFVDDYPVPINFAGLAYGRFNRIWPAITAGTSAQLVEFRRRFADGLSSVQVTQLSNLYVEKLISERSKGPVGFFDKWRAVRRAAEVGFRPSGVKDFSVTAVQITSDHANTTEPHATILSDLDVGVRALTASKIAADPQVGTVNYLVLIRTDPIVIERKVVEKSQVRSRVQIGSRSVPNSAFTAAQAKFIQAQSEYNTQRIKNATTPAYGALAGLVQGLGEGILANEVEKARQELADTPATIEEPVFQQYKFDISTIEVSRQVRIRIWIIDHLQGTVARHEVPQGDKKSFRIAYNIQEADPDFYATQSRYDREQLLDAYEKENVMIKLSSVAERVLTAAPRFISMRAESSILSEASAPDETPRVAAAISTTKNLAQTGDSRFDSIVVVKNPNGGLGTGFFVAPDMVLTNYHVVEGSRIAEVKLRNGLEAVGRVVKSDIGLDLAIIKVTDRGIPVVFANASVTTGSTVEAIGHPSGLEFSVTRGIVSAIRKMPNSLVPGSREMLVIQTDAAISPGNSGGPLFLGNQVIGVNSQKLVRRGVEGIGFALHYTEVLRFLQEQ